MSCFAKDRLNGKVAIITASTNGIGLGIARRLAQEGAKVIISSRKQKNVDEALQKLKLEEGLEVTGTVCHVGKAEDRAKLFELAVSKYHGLDILVSNAAVNPIVAPVLDTKEESWNKIFDVNVKASFLLAKEALPYLQKREGGKIIFISSIAGYAPIYNIGAYSVSKTALLGLTKVVAMQLATSNIQVNCIAPGAVPTKFSAVMTSNQQEMYSNIPMKRFGTPEDIAAAAAFLASGDSDYITGETIVVAGGWLSRL